jgi:hypothetical protein
LLFYLLYTLMNPNSNSNQQSGVKKADAYLHSLKMSIQSRLSDYKRRGGVNDVDAYHNDIMELVKTFDAISFGVGDDTSKRKRVKNVVPLFDRCIAKRASGEQCTRRKKEGEGYCGTHIKGRPHGCVNQAEEQFVTNKKVEVWIREIKGIVYYVDANKNVYDPEDILANKINPRIIMKLEG